MCCLRGAVAVHQDDAVDVLLHEIARLLLETGGKDVQLFRGREERHAVVHHRPVHVASALFGNNIGFAVYHPTTAIIPRQVLADSGFDHGMERAHADNLCCSMGFMPRRVNVHLEQRMDLPWVGVLSTQTMAIW
jgi:hypothetical protein